MTKDPFAPEDLNTKPEQPTAKNCPYCGEPNLPDVEKCKKCGRLLYPDKTQLSKKKKPAKITKGQSQKLTKLKIYLFLFVGFAIGIVIGFGINTTGKIYSDKDLATERLGETIFPRGA